MRLYSMKSSRALARLVQAGAALTAAALVAGCGSNYKAVVTPVNSSGAAAQVTSYAVAVSAPSDSTGVATIIDYSGDTVMAYASFGASPYNFTLDELGSEGYTYNRDGTLTNFPISTSLQAKNVLYSTLPTNSDPVNWMAPSSGLWAADLMDKKGVTASSYVVDLFSGSPEAFKESIPTAATTPVFIAGAPTSSGQREYAISQGFTDSTGVTCNTGATSVTAPGYATPIEISTDTADTPIEVGACPVFAVQTPNLKRLFVINRGSDTITVINTVNNALDTCTPYQNVAGQWVTCHPTIPLSQNALTATSIVPPNCTSKTDTVCGAMPQSAEPVFAEYNATTQQLIVADYAGGTISVIDVPLDEYGNDSNTYSSCTSTGTCTLTGGFGSVHTIKVGRQATSTSITTKPYPASVTVLYDGSKAYTANQGDDSGDGNGTVTVVNLSSYSVEKTLEVVGHPRTVVSTQNSEYSKIYAASPDSDYLTVLESTGTSTDIVDTTILVDGNVVDVRTTTQNGSSGNINYTSRTPGYGLPCNLPPSLLTPTSAETCRNIP
jgi:DNA-binding beta-propeller fold protein YncE